MSCPICGKQSLSSSNLYCREHNKEELVEEYLNAIALRLSADYGLSFEVAARAVKDLDLLNIFEDDYELLLHEDISTWVELAYKSYKANTKVSQFLEYTEQPTIKNTRAGDMISYKDKLWFNNGDIVVPIGYVKKGNNYIVINGKKTELTEEQLNYLCVFNRFAQMAKEQFGLTITPKETAGETFKTLFGGDFSDCSERKNPFNSELNYRDYRECYYMISPIDGIISQDIIDESDEKNIINANSFNDKDFANQVYLHELLNRKLLKYAWDNNAEDREWDNQNPHYYIRRYLVSNLFYIQQNILSKNCGTIYFSAEEVAEQAIEDVVEPFIAEHPEFVW